MKIDVYGPTGLLRERWDDDTRTYSLMDGTGALSAQRAYTEVENSAADVRAAQETADKNRSSLSAKGVQALTDNTAYLAVASPTNAQVAAQVKALTRQVNGLIRLVLGRLESDT